MFQFYGENIPSLQDAQNHVINIIWIRCFQLGAESVAGSSHLYFNKDIKLNIYFKHILLGLNFISENKTNVNEQLPLAVKFSTEVTLAGPQ